MHLYFYLRGKPEWIAVAEAHLQSQYFKWDRTNLETGELEERPLQAGLRKSVLGAYEYVFPGEAMGDVLAYLGIEEKRIGAVRTPKLLLNLAVLRKIFGAKPITKKMFKDAEQQRKFSCMTIKGSYRCLPDFKNMHVSMHMIGFKKDRREKNKAFGYDQEML